MQPFANFFVMHIGHHQKEFVSLSAVAKRPSTRICCWMSKRNKMKWVCVLRRCRVCRLYIKGNTHSNSMYEIDAKWTCLIFIWLCWTMLSLRGRWDIIEIRIKRIIMNIVQRSSLRVCFVRYLTSVFFSIHCFFIRHVETAQCLRRRHSQHTVDCRIVSRCCKLPRTQTEGSQVNRRF